MNRRLALLAACGIAACAAVPTEPQEPTREELIAALRRALELLAVSGNKLDQQDAQIKKMHDMLSTECNFS